MRLGPFDFGRRADDKAVPAAPDEIGASGTLNTQGLLVQHEYNSDLRGRDALDVFDRMRRSDASVQEALQHIFAPIKNGNWNIEAADQEDADCLEHAEFIRRSYGMGQGGRGHSVTPWMESLTEQLKYLAFGHYVFEIVYQVVEDGLEFDGPDGDKMDVPSRQFLTLRRLAPRLPWTIWKWNMDEEYHGELKSITQHVYNTPGGAANSPGYGEGGYGFADVEIPFEKLLVLTNDREGDDYTGISLLRPAYKPWVMKETIEKTAVVAIERHGVGIMNAFLPKQYENDARMLTRVEEMLQNIRAGEFTYLVWPGPEATASQDGFTFKIVGPQGTAPDFSGQLSYQRAEIKAAVLARFAELGHAQTGARATGDTQSQVWYDALHAVARYICDAHDHVIKQLIDMNYPGVNEYPKMIVQDLEARNLQEFADSISKLVASGILLPTPNAREYTRTYLRMPEEEESEEIVSDQQDRNPIEEDPNAPVVPGETPAPTSEPSKPDKPAPQDSPGSGSASTDGGK